MHGNKFTGHMLFLEIVLDQARALVSGYHGNLECLKVMSQIYFTLLTSQVMYGRERLDIPLFLGKCPSALIM